MAERGLTARSAQHTRHPYPLSKQGPDGNPIRPYLSQTYSAVQIHPLSDHTASPRSSSIIVACKATIDGLRHTCSPGCSSGTAENTPNDNITRACFNSISQNTFSLNASVPSRFLRTFRQPLGPPRAATPPAASRPGSGGSPTRSPRRTWIGNTYLDGFDRISPAFLNSTGLMWPSVEWILKLLHRCT